MGKVSYANRGMHLEKLIDMSNQQYRIKGIAEINKEPTPIKPIKTRGNIITHAVYEKKGRVDYYGIYDGKHLSFDAKSTRERTRFPLDNIKDHQIEHLKSVHEKGGQAFILIEFAKHHEVYLVPYTKIAEYWESSKGGGRKSIPYEDMLQFPKVTSGRGIVLDYLSVL